MKERLKIARKTLKLTQSEFGRRIGVTDGAISNLEKGERNITDQMVIAVCREFGISEDWLRTGNGEMFVVTENAIIRQLSEQYDLDALDQIIVESYMSLPKAHRDAIKGFVCKIANASNLPGVDTEIAEELVVAAQNAEDEYRAEWNKGLTEEEALQLVRDRYAAAKRGTPSSTTYEKAGNA